MLCDYNQVAEAGPSPASILIVLLRSNSALLLPSTTSTIIVHIFYGGIIPCLLLVLSKIYIYNSHPRLTVQVYYLKIVDIK